MDAAGLTRNFLLHVPPHRPRGLFGFPRDYPLVIVLHGSNADADDIRGTAALDSVGDAHGMLTAYPNGTTGALGLFPSDWNAGDCCGAASRDDVDDVAMLRALIERVSRELPVDRRRIYIAGFSDGGRLAYRAACTLAPLVAAIAVVSGSLRDDGCAPAAPVSVIAFHGTADDEVPYDDGVLPPNARPLPSAAASLPPAIRFWAARDHCSGFAARRVAEHVTRTTFAPCGSADVVLYTIEGGTHGWPGEANARPPMNEIGATAAISAFFLRHVLGNGDAGIGKRRR